MSDGKLEMATGHGVLPEYDVDDKWVGGVGRRLWMIVRKLRFTVNGQVSVTTVNPRPPHKIYKFSRHDPPRSVEEKERKGAFPCSTLERKRIISGERPRLAATQACLNVHADGNMVPIYKNLNLYLALCSFALRPAGLRL